MRVADGLSTNNAQAEPFRGVQIGRLELAVVEGNGLRASALEKQLAVIGAGAGLSDDPARLFL